MSSSFAWLDYSEQERRRALDVISLFKQAETRDELGLGSIRDALADRFSPGTMTLQTRAKYFLLIPWMYQYFEQRQVESRKLDLLSRQFEIRLIDILADSADSGGTIGIESRKVLQRMPSSIYWAGLPKRLGPGEVEEGLYSGDRLDVFFADSNQHVAVEVKGRSAPLTEIMRGLFQCVKYEAVLEAQARVKGLQLDCKALLALGGSLPEGLVPLRNTLGVDVYEDLDLTD